MSNHQSLLRLDLAGPEGRRMKTFTCLPMLEAWFW